LIDCNQMGRRNLTPDQMAMILGRRYNRAKKVEGRPSGKLGQNEPVSMRTSAALAAEHGVSEMTVRRAGEFAADDGEKPEARTKSYEPQVETISSPAEKGPGLVSAAHGWGGPPTDQRKKC